MNKQREQKVGIERGYYNLQSMLLIVCVVLMYVLTNATLFDFDQPKHYTYATVLYGFVLFVCIVGTQIEEEGYQIEKNNSYRAVADFTFALFCIWFSAIDIFLVGHGPSKFSGFTLAIGTFALFLFMCRLPFYFLNRLNNATAYKITLILVKLIGVTLLFVSLSLMVFGSWTWKLEHVF